MIPEQCIGRPIRVMGDDDILAEQRHSLTDLVSILAKRQIDSVAALLELIVLGTDVQLLAESMIALYDRLEVAPVRPLFTVVFAEHEQGLADGLQLLFPADTVSCAGSEW